MSSPTSLPTSVLPTTLAPPSSAPLTSTLPGTTSTPSPPSAPSSPVTTPPSTSSPSPSPPSLPLSSPSSSPVPLTSTDNPNPTGSTTPSTTTTSSSSSTHVSSSTTASQTATSTSVGTTSTTPTTTSMSSVMTQVPTTITSTNAVGSTVYITSQISTYTTVAATPVSNATTSSNTGAIVGGVVGGIAAIGLLGLLLFCIHRRRRKSEFDGNFDPDRVVSHPSGGGTLPQVDLGDDHEITPFPDHGSMRQYGDSPYFAVGAGAGAASLGRATSGGPGRATSPLSSPSHYSDTGTSFYPTSVGSPSAEGYPSQAFMRPGPQGQGQGTPNMYAMQQADWHNPRPMTSPPPSVSNTSSSGRAMKEMEARGDRQGLGLATQQEADGESSGVVQHQDAGQVPSDEGVPPRDIPPAYDSIRQ